MLRVGVELGKIKHVASNTIRLLLHLQQSIKTISFGGIAAVHALQLVQKCNHCSRPFSHGVDDELLINLTEVGSTSAYHFVR